MAKRSCLGQPIDDYIYFDGTGYKEPGDVCALYGEACATDLVRFDGTGLRQVTASTPVGNTCPAVSGAVYFNGTGLVTVDVPAQQCGG